MKVIVHRVTHASVTVNNQIIGSINKGYLILFGASQNDTEKDAQKLADKILGLRIFSDENDKINLSLKDVDGEILIVSQFTLYADCKKGNRPSFVKSCEPHRAKELYEYFINSFNGKVKNVQTGKFGADMKVELLNDGPFTVIIECNEGIISSC